LKQILLFLLFFSTLFGATSDDVKLKKMIGRMLVVGFKTQSVDKNSQIVKDMQKYDLGGVILFDKCYKERTKTKNISSPQQLKQLTSELKNFSTKPLFISVDQEGGKVARLKPSYGFTKISSAATLSKMGLDKAQKIYELQSQMLQNEGINMNFAPVVDLAVNPKNKVIVGLQRSFSPEVKKVVAYASVMIQEQKKHNIISVLKHFPGHGSSLGDSHKGFVDVSETWTKKELEPYYALIKTKQVDMIMTAHVFNSHLDNKYPATLSYKCNTNLLRKKMGFKGLIISDDLQMGAITQHYSLKERVKLAINSGVDILLFGNQLEQNSVKEIVDAIYSQVQSGAIPLEKIKQANQRIENLHTKYSIIQKPIHFGEQRKRLTREYIKQHYGMDVKNIKIIPKLIVLHWTAVMDFKKSFQRLDAELLYSDRADIANASALNVSAHFLVDRDGKIYQLMPENFMARHVIGLNYSSIGIENVGGENNAKDDLTPAQLQANIKLVKYLKAKYPSIKQIIGHYEYRDFENSPLWLEKDAGYRTKKADPGKRFVDAVKAGVDE
jgi:beta-N-acetylhexosaminidase